MGILAVIVAGALPGADSREVRWLQSGDVPLIGGEVGNPVHADLAVAPRLRSGPLDAPVNVVRLAHGFWIEESGRSARAACVNAQANVAVRYPFLRIHYLEGGVFGAGALGYLWKDRRESVPGRLPAFLKGEPFPIWPVAQYDGISAVAERAENVSTQNGAVVHFDRRIPCLLY